jgi:hypothetical protein
MPEFILNNTAETNHPYISASDFVAGYVEALFFTNGDSGDDDPDSFNELGTGALSKEAIESIIKDCQAFEEAAADLLEEAYCRDYEEEQAGRDFWFTRQGHGVGFWDRKALQEGELGDRLSNVAQKFRESYAYIGDDGAIYIQ